MASVAIIGMGAVAAPGMGVDACFDAARRGDDGLTPLSRFDSGLKVPPWVGQVEADIALRIGHEPVNRTLGLAICAADECFVGMPDRDALRLGIVFATTVAGITRSEVFYREYLGNPAMASCAAAELSHHEPTALTGELARRYHAQGFFTVSTACSTGLHAIGMAKRLIDHNLFDLCLAIGADALSILTVRGFNSLVLLDPHGCRPFDKNRAGISLGEGAGALLLASDSAVSALQTPPCAWVSGWGASADCHHMTAPHPQGIGAQSAIHNALLEAGLPPSAIDYVITHGTGTPDNDTAEINALRRVCTTHPPFSSLKRCFGHTLAASGSLESVMAVRALQNNTLLASPGFETIDETIGCEPVRKTTGKTLNHVLKTAFGFGGNNAAILFSKNRQVISR